MSKTNQNMKAKKRTLTTREAQVRHRPTLYTYVPDANAAKPPGWVLDMIADKKLTGGFNVRRSNICETCFTAKSSNGTCAC